MRSRFSIPNVPRSVAYGAAAVAIFGCAQASQPGLSSTKPTVATAGYYSFAASSARPLVAAHTVSFALDRIDQRDLPLDQTYRHAGTGQGVTVYVFDGGVSTNHPELAGRVRIGYTAFPDDPEICNAHGTAVAGAIAGKTLGVAPDAEIVDVKMVQCEKLRGTIEAIVDGAQWAIQDHKEHPGRRRSRTGRSSPTRPRAFLHSTARSAQLRAAGIPVIVSAGNVDINACRVSPGNSDGTIVVGASALIRRRGGRHDAHDRPPRAGYGVGPMHRPLRPGRLRAAAEPRRDRSPTRSSGTARRCRPAT